MSESVTPDEPTQKQTPDEIAADIEATRARLAGNVDALTDKLDVKAQAKGKVQEATGRVQDAAGDVRDRVVGVAGSAQQSLGSATDSALAGSRSLVDRFLQASRGVQAAVVAAPLSLVVILIIRRARS